MKPIEFSRPPWELYSYEKLLHLMAGNVDAVQFLLDIARCSHVYDDLIDKDKPIPDEAVHDLVWTMLISMPLNPFYAANHAALRPVLITAILNWRAANEMEASSDAEELRIAHVLRYSLADLILLCMVLTGGPAHAARNAKLAALISREDTWANYFAESSKKGKSC